MRKPQLLSDILRLRVFVKGVTHVEVGLDFRLLGYKDLRPQKDVFKKVLHHCRYIHGN